MAWIFLTLGITVGSGWAYYELGWGGWWFWDPVENASFMPWLVGTALIHLLAVTEKEVRSRAGPYCLRLRPFARCSAPSWCAPACSPRYAFATDPRRGMYILALLVLVIGISLLLFAWRAPSLSGGGKFDPMSRETMLLVNNVLLAVAAASVLLGTLYPLFVDALGLGKISVGPPYFQAVFVPIMVPVVLLMVIGPSCDGRPRPFQLLRHVAPGWGASVGSASRWRSPPGLHLGHRHGAFTAAWVMIASGMLLSDRLRERPGAAASVRLRGIPAHGGDGRRTSGSGCSSSASPW